MSSTAVADPPAPTTDPLEQYRRNTRAGAALLDKHDAGWADRVDKDTLDLSSSRKCVLGQLYGFGNGLRQLNVVVNAEDYGFAVFCDPDSGGCTCDDGGEYHRYAVLEDQWRNEIAARVSSDAS